MRSASSGRISATTIRTYPRATQFLERLGARDGPSIGVVRHLSNYVVLKIQYGRLGERDKPSANDLNAATGGRVLRDKMKTLIPIVALIALGCASSC